MIHLNFESGALIYTREPAMTMDNPSLFKSPWWLHACASELKIDTIGLDVNMDDKNSRVQALQLHLIRYSVHVITGHYYIIKTTSSSWHQDLILLLRRFLPVMHGTIY